MLTIYVDDVRDDKKAVIRDVERLFAQIKPEGTSIDKKLISYIEQGKYNDKNSFIDRFGFKLHLSELSTGCKAALCVANCPDKIIDLIECGNNARDIIISLCKDGKVLIRDNGITFKSYSNSVCVRVDDYVITDIDRLNKYVFDERPFEPDMNVEGIEYVQHK